MDEIGQEPRHDLRLPPGPRRWLTVAGVVLLVAAVAVYGVSRLGGRHGAAADGPSATPWALDTPLPRTSFRIILQAGATPAPPPAATPGTVLVTCGSAVFSQDPDWQAGSLRVGTLWFIAGRSLGYVHVGRTSGAATAQSATAKRVVGVWVEMLVHVDPGVAVAMRAAVGTGPAFEFLGSPDSAGGFRGLDGARGYTFVPCPAADSGGGRTGFYDLGFSIVPGRAAAAEVWTSPSARPVWLTFRAPEPGTARG
jgi:hypothetical protein